MFSLPVIWRASLRYTLRHPWQLALSILGIALGVAVVVSIDLAIESSQRAFALASEGVVGRSTHQIRGGARGIDEAVYVDLRRQLRAVDSAPVVQGRVLLADAARRAMVLVGVDPLAEGPFRTHAGMGQTPGAVPLAALLTRPGSVLVSAATAGELGLAAGDTLHAQAGGRSLRLRIAGLLQPRNALHQAQVADLLITDISSAQELLGQIGRLTRIDLAIPDSAHGASLLEAVRARLPPGLRVAPAGERQRTARQMTRAFNLNLFMLSLLALVVGLFLIYNTMTFSVLQRRTLIGGLRALGVSRRQVCALILGEASLLALAGVVIGIALGLVLARELLELVARTINDLYFSLRVSEVNVSAVVLAKGALLGWGAAIAAAALPAIEATRVPPGAVLARSHIERRTRKRVPAATAGGVAVLVVGAACIALPGGDVRAGFAGLVAIVAGFALLVPVATIGLVWGLSWVAERLAGTLGPLAMRGITSSLSRTAVAIAALMVAIAASIGVGVMVDSFRRSVADWLDTTLQADFYLGVSGSGEARLLDPSLVRRLETLPGIAHLSLGRRAEVETPRGPVEVLALRMAPQSYRGFTFLAGAPASAWPAFNQAGAVLVSEPYAWRHGVRVGGRVELLTRAGAIEFPIVGIYRDYGSDRGEVLMSRATYARHWDDWGVTGIGVYARPGVRPEALLQAVRRVLPEEQAVLVHPTGAIREASLRIFDRTFTITNVLRTLAVAIAFVGVLSALMALQLERAREIAVLRAQGFTRAQVWILVEVQTGVMGLMAGLLAIPLGLAMALVLVLVINRRSFGWSMDIHVDPAILAQALALAVIAALLAGLYPAYRMARMAPAEGLREE